MAAAPTPYSSPDGEALLSRLRRELQCSLGVRLAMLFGSQARGRASADSDVDVAVLAPREDLLALASRLSDACGRVVDVVGLDDPGIPLLEELVRDAQLIYEGEPGSYALWRSRALTLLDIDGPAHARMRDSWLARVAQRGL